MKTTNDFMTAFSRPASNLLPILPSRRELGEDDSNAKWS
jgi:hypothetical protein